MSSAASIEWTDPVHAMLAFAQNLQECRKLQFAKYDTLLFRLQSLVTECLVSPRYFSHSSQLAMSAWSTGDSDALAQCGHCDNCTRGPEEVECKDVTVQAWQLVKITQALNNEGANITLNSLAALARGNGGGAYEVTRGGKTGKGKGKAKEKQTLDLDAIAGGTVDLTKDEIEHLLVELIIKQYLAEKYQQTAYSTNVYVTGGPIAPALSRHTRESIATARGVNVEYAFRKRPTKAKAKAPSSSRKPGSSTGKRKRVAPDSDDDEHEEIDIFQDDDDGDEDDDSIIIEPQTQKGASPRHFALSEEDSDDGDEIDGDWQVSIRKKGPPPSKRTRSSGSRTAPPGNLKGKVITENDRAVIVLSESD
ncbi:hypothetical protein H0H81_004114 [Sphagnurus paluster]|uniref:Uncharacterized protein n=1 Tax=Sphagnurus paluster TaxID=117069 RepID=A0A9P7GTI3_9AGAR|nr:hypothetical protein H0H81_004114 [Sphagnurus paluster]